MIAADTNLLIHHLTQDEATQAGKVAELFEEAELREEPIFIAQIVLCEVCWVLKAVFGFKKPQICLALQGLLDDGTFYIEERPLAEKALELYARHAGQFPDHLLGVIAKHHGATTTYTFDKEVGKFRGFTLLK